MLFTLTLEDAVVILREMTNSFLPWQPCSRVGGSLILELETCMPVRAWTGTSLTKPVTLPQSFWERLLLRRGICPFLTTFFFSASKAYGVTLESEVKSVCVYF